MIASTPSSPSTGSRGKRGASRLSPRVGITRGFRARGMESRNCGQEGLNSDLKSGA